MKQLALKLFFEFFIVYIVFITDPILIMLQESNYITFVELQFFFCISFLRYQIL